MRRLARIVARNLARNVTCGSAFSTFFVLGLLFRASGVKVVRSVVRSLGRNVARNVARNARPSAVLQHALKTTLFSAGNQAISRYVTLPGIESGPHGPREATRKDLGLL